MMMTRPALISTIESITRPLQQNIINLGWKIDELSNLVKDKKVDEALQKLEALQVKIDMYEKLLKDVGPGKKTDYEKVVKEVGPGKKADYEKLVKEIGLGNKTNRRCLDVAVLRLLETQMCTDHVYLDVPLLTFGSC